MFQEGSSISKIVDTYQFRKEEERYSRRVPLEEIKSNDFNLNISRYISTAVPEDKIELSEEHKKLVDIENEISKAKESHNEFLKELGLSPLP
ncbi:N-6 DNA methylase [Yersinia bercovieri]|uniref:N-6 DNA methylase n=1 Tax=Yersinia bercovieri TaxID=634 RepID=UPI0021BDC18D|nr:N-6 DNA methylase [Yersinia bercovieri]